MTCMEMFWNGARTGLAHILKGVSLILWGQWAASTACCAAAIGTTAAGLLAPHTAAGASLATAAAAAVSVLPEVIKARVFKGAEQRRGGEN